jgi:precorrin-3B C17-methyltransferase
VVGIGPGGPLDRTFRAQSAIEASEVIAGYKRYIKAVDDLIGDKTIIATGMTKEVERCQQAIKAASEGKVVALISSGDAGIYGMAGLALEMIQAEQYEIEVEVIPGVTAASAAAARLGAPLMLDFAIISLSEYQ